MVGYISCDSVKINNNKKSITINKQLATWLQYFCDLLGKKISGIDILAQTSPIFSK